MKNISTLVLLALALVCFSCGGKKTTDQLSEAEVEAEVPQFPQIVPFETGIETEREILLSQIADSVQYIPLETNNNCLIKSINTGAVIRTKKYWFLPWVETLFQFTAEGKFVRKIGSKGGGPGQYTWVQQANVNEEKGLVFMLTTSKKINVYDMETGKFLYDMKIPSIETGSFGMLNDSVAATFIPNSNGMRAERVFLSGAKGDTLNTFYRTDLFQVPSGTSWMMSGLSDRYLFRYEDMVCYKEYTNDTLFVITEKELHPRYIINLGKYSIPMECRMEACDGDWKKYESVAAPYIRNQVIETEPYLFMPYNYWAGEKARQRQMALYDKKQKECFKVAGGYIINDLSGGLPLRPVTSLDSHTLLYVWEVEDIMKEAEKNPAVLENELLKGVGEDDNPVLMVVHLKK